MATSGTLGSKLLQIILPKKKANEKGISQTSTYSADNADQVLAAPDYRDHLSDIYTTRQSEDSRTLLANLFRNDPDASASVNAYLTVANTDPEILVYDELGEPDREGQKTIEAIIQGLVTRNDYSTGFAIKPGLKSIATDMRYMILLRGGCAAELVMNKLLVPAEVRHIDLASIQWFEKIPGQYKPWQEPSGGGDLISLDIPTFFTAWYRKNPTSIYSHSPFVSAINTVAARAQVINDLYRIMQITGYPRVDIKVMEEILRKNAPAKEQQNENLMRLWISARLSEIANQIANLRPDQAFVHLDAVEPSIMNQGGPAKSMDVTAVIEVLNSMNQAAFKIMGTIIGRGEAGVNTASVEARIFTMNAEELNVPVAEILSSMFTLALRLQGSTSRVEVWFKPVELRPATELEPMMVTKQARFLELLSYGILGDDAFHLEMFGRFRPDAVPELSGTLFFNAKGAGVDTSSISPNSDSLGRSITPSGSKATKSNQNKSAANK